MATIPAGTTLRNRLTGEPFGVTTTPIVITPCPIVIHISCNAAPMIEALRQAAESMRQLSCALGRDCSRVRYLAALRYQAKRKGRPGWKRIAIPKRRRTTTSRED